MTPLPLWLKGMTPELAKKAELELGETADVKQRSLEELKQLIKREPNLNSCLDDSFLLRFLRHRKYDVKKAFKTLCNYYRFKARYSGLYTGFKPSDLVKVMQMNCMRASDKRDPSGAFIGVLRLEKFDLNIATEKELLATLLMIGEVLMIETEIVQVCGMVLIGDFSGLNEFNMMKHFTPAFFYIVAKALKDVYPLRIVGLHCLNEPFYLRWIYSVIKPFVSKKLQDRIHFHGNDVTSLHRYAAPELLPTEFGGTLGPVCSRDVQAHVLTHESYFEELNKYGYLK